MQESSGTSHLLRYIMLREGIFVCRTVLQGARITGPKASHIIQGCQALGDTLSTAFTSETGSFSLLALIDHPRAVSQRGFPRVQETYASSTFHFHHISWYLAPSRLESYRHDFPQFHRRHREIYPVPYQTAFFFLLMPPRLLRYCL